MQFRSLTFAAAILMFAGIVDAHTHLKSATPADNSVLAAAPKQIVLNFSEPTRLTALALQKEGEKDEKAVSPLPKEASVAVSVPVQALTSGKYQINWRAIGPDNHVMSGVLHFTVTAK